MVNCAPDFLRIQQGVDLLTLYQWNTYTTRHYFFKICGIYTVHQRRKAQLVYSVNLGGFHHLDLVAF